MTRLDLIVAAALVCATAPGTARAQAPATLNLMPVPSSVTVRNGSINIDSTFRVAVVHGDDPRLMRAVAYK